MPHTATTIMSEDELKELTATAEQGDTDTQNHLGWIFENGEGVPCDYDAAIKWYIFAANKVTQRQYNMSKWRITKNDCQWRIK